MWPKYNAIEHSRSTSLSDVFVQLSEMHIAYLYLHVYLTCFDVYMKVKPITYLEEG